MFVIEDETHAEIIGGRYSSFEEAFAVIRHRAKIPWNKPPNIAPCTDWNKCGRHYQIVEFDDTKQPWKEKRRVPVLNISASGIEWLFDADEQT